MALLSSGKALVTAPTAEPVTVEEAKDHLRVTADSEDNYIRGLIKVARSRVETDTKRALVTQTWDEFFDGFPGTDTFELTLPPVASITSVTYLDGDGASQTLGTSVYELDGTQWPGAVRLKWDQDWPVTRSIHKAVTVRFIAGEAVTAVPESAKHAVKLLIEDMFCNRGPSGEGSLGVHNINYQGLISTLRWGSYV